MRTRYNANEAMTVAMPNHNNDKARTAWLIANSKRHEAKKALSLA